MTTTPPPAYDPGEPALDAVYELSAGPYRSGELHVLSFEGHEEMNGLFAFEVTFWAKDADHWKGPGGAQHPVVALLVSFSFLTSWLIAAVLRRSRPRSAPLVTLVASLCSAGALYVLTRAWLSRQLSFSSPGSSAFSPGSEGLLLLAAFPAGSAVGLALDALVRSRGWERSVSRATGGLAGALLVASTIVAGHVLWRSTDRPSLDHYMRELALVGEVPHVANPWPGYYAGRALPPATHHDAAADLSVTRACDAQGDCRLAIAGSNSTVADVDFRADAPTVRWSADLRLFRQARSNMILVQTMQNPWTSFLVDDAKSSRVDFEGRLWFRQDVPTYAHVRVTPGDVAKGTSPPQEWLASAALGLALALATWLRRYVVRYRGRAASGEAGQAEIETFMFDVQAVSWACLSCSPILAAVHAGLGG